MALWRTDSGKPERLAASGVPLESQLEDYIEADPALLGTRLMLIGRQVPTAHGGFVDLLAVDVVGGIHVFELKRDKTPRDVVAQTLDYGSWVASLDHGSIVEIFDRYRPDIAFDEAFGEAFGGDVPDELNTSQSLTIVAASVDSATERIVTYLNESFGVPINVVFFRHFEDRGASYLARSWLVSHESEIAPKTPSRAVRTREAWNGSDWYASFGDDAQSRSWKDARRYGFVSAGGGEWYSRSLKNLPVGARVFVCIPKRGYVAVGTVVGLARAFDDAVVQVDGEERLLSSLPLEGTYRRSADGLPESEVEWVVPTAWTATRDASQAIWRTGMFANQNSACRLSKQFTIDAVLEGLGIAQDDS